MTLETEEPQIASAHIGYEFARSLFDSEERQRLEEERLRLQGEAATKLFWKIYQYMDQYGEGIQQHIVPRTVAYWRYDPGEYNSPWTEIDTPSGKLSVRFSAAYEKNESGSLSSNMMSGSIEFKGGDEDEVSKITLNAAPKESIEDFRRPKIINPLPTEEMGVYIKLVDRLIEQNDELGIPHREEWYKEDPHDYH